MKKAVCTILGMLMVFTLSACSDNGGPSEPSDSSGVQSSRQEESSEEPVKQYGEKLENTFGKLWGGESYFIDVKMYVDGVLFEDEVSQQIVGGSGVTQYTYQIAVDQAADKAMLIMHMPEGTTGHLIVDKDVCYKLDDEAKTYESQEYPYNAKAFGEMYTTDLYLGMMNYLQLEDSGTKQFTLPDSDKPVSLDYETYRLKADSEASNAVTEAHITYCFKDGVPYAELLETDKGKTTYLFRTVSGKIKDPSIFTIPEDYSAA